MPLLRPKNTTQMLKTFGHYLLLHERGDTSFADHFYRHKNR